MLKCESSEVSHLGGAGPWSQFAWVQVLPLWLPDSITLSTHAASWAAFRCLHSGDDAHPQAPACGQG